MNQAILALEKQKAELLRNRNKYKLECDKETELFEPTIKRFDKEIDQVVSDIKKEWNKLYNKNEKQTAKAA